MSEDLTQLEEMAGRLLANLTGPRRLSLLRAVARDLRHSQRDRIARQENPDGTPYSPRKEQPQPEGKLRRRRGSVRRKAMFRRLRTYRLLKASVTEQEIWVGYTGPAARVARIHQFGLRDRPAPKARDVRYDKRKLLGLTPTDREHLLDLVLNHIEN